MARNHARIHVSTYDPGAGFTDLTLTQQGLYWMLVARRDISACGVLPYKPRVWAQRTGSPLEDLEDALTILLRGDYIVIDDETDELWVRTFIYHDRILTMPQMAMKMAAAFDAVDSLLIRRRIVDSLPPLLREGFPENLKGPRKDVIAELERTDAATYKPPANNPTRNPYGNGSDMGCTELVDNGSHNPSDNRSSNPTGKGRGMGKGQGYRAALDADADSLLSQERVTGGPLR